MSYPTRFLWAAVLVMAGTFALVAPAAAQTGIQFDGVNDYVTFGAAPSLGASTFTLEVRFKRTATGVGVSTGTGGLTSAVPLVTKGRAESESPANLNMNYFLGINNSAADATVGVLCADFENNAGGGNHRVFGVSPVLVDGLWHHAAATYDGTTWRLYLDGNLEATLVVNQTPEATSIQHAGLGTAMTSGGGAAGFFAGILDEARIWNVVRSQTDIQANQNVEIQSAPGLIGHWALNEGSGIGAGNSVASGANGTLTNGPVWTTDATVPLLTAAGLRFGGSATGYVTFGDPSALDLAQFTLECWFRRDGAGTPNSTGTGGVTAVPLVAHGGPEAETPTNLNMNYFLGIRNDGLLCADFEEGAAGPSPGLNHPISGTTTISNGVWYHAAATYDGTTWRLYLNGNLEATLAVGRPVESGTIQRASLATTLTSAGAPAGTPLWFNGAIDEARIWNSARSQPDIISMQNTEITGAVAGLVARWGLNEDALTTVASSAGGVINGTLTGTNWSWTSGSPFNAVPQSPPDAPTGLTATAISTTQIDLAWSDVATTETGYEVERSTTGIGGTYTLLVSLPAGSTGYSNLALTPTSQYCYRVRAVNAGGASAYDGPTCATTQTPVPPPAPTGLVATATSFSQVHLAWADNASNETGYEVERSTTGIGGAYSLVTTLGVDAVAYDDLNRSPATEYCYRVRAINGLGPSGYAGPTCATTPGSALDFGSAATTYVTFGDPAALDLAQFTVECWFRRDGAGAAISTGGSGVTAVPLVTHGAPQSDGSDVDMNYFLGIRSSDGVLCADFEEGPGGAGPVGLNHPVIGVTPVGSGWHHGAATYNGTTWRLYLDGNLETTLAVGQPVRSNSIQHAALATALTSTGGTNGFFDGVLDEVRVWSLVRTQAEIQSSANSQITTPAAGLAARWGLDEGAGTAVNGSAGTVVNGSITGANFTWTGAAPFNLVFTPPDAPTGLIATAVTHSQITLSWTDVATTEAGYEIERSTTGIGGSYSPLITVAANTTTYANIALSASTEYCYRVRAVNGSGASGYAGPVCAITLASGNTALGFSGSTAQPSYASFGNPAALQLSALTIEMWLRRDGPGEGTNTGTGGIADAIPLVAKGRAETETATTDINYLFGIRAATGALCADFEEGAAGASPSLNHPIEGATVVTMGVWHHVAATYDGISWKLFLDGNLDASVDIGQPLASASTAAVALASALTTTNVAAGFFNGVVDEVRIWNVARDQAQIQSTANAQLAIATPGLVARWSLDEGSGTAIGASAGTTANGTITGLNYAWSSPGAPFDLAFNQQPGAPVLVAPGNGATGVPASPSLEVTASDPEGGNLTVSYYGRAVAPSPGPDFTLIGLPDTQYYTGEVNGGTNAIFQSQTNWMVANRVSRNIVYVGQLGDCVERGDNSGNDIEWQRADASLTIIENPGTTGLPDGIPFGVSVGNHDQSPIGNPDGTTTFYNQYFGEARFLGRAYYGGHHGTNNDNWYDLFSASGMDFIVISFEYDTTPDAAVLSWADNLLATYANRRAIVLSHFICNTGNPAGFGPQGQAIYNALRSRPNLDLMLCGHVPGEGRRQDTFNGNIVHTLLSDYQGRANGGNGWLRILEFSPANNEIRVKTFSPWLNQFETDGDSEFSVFYDMVSAPPFQLIGTVAGVPSGSNSSLVWSGLTPGAAYEWYATVGDGSATTVGPVWSFTTGAGTHTITATAGANGAISPSGAVVVSAGADQSFTFTPAAGYHVSAVTVDLNPVAAAPGYTFTNVAADHTIDVQFEINPAVAPVANLSATQVVPGALGEATTAIQLTWDATPGGTTVEVWRKGFGSYPEYDDAGGVAPTASASYPPGAGWVKVDDLDTPGEMDLVAGRDVIYYVAYARDGLGTWSPTSTMTAGTLNYLLGDVTNGLTAGAGNNKVHVEDVSLLGAFYGVTGGAMTAVNYLDLGPTTTNYVDGRPMTDDQIDFEDLVLFAINYGLGQTSPALVARRAAVAGASSSSGDELLIEATNQVTAGETVTARLRLRGSGALIAVTARFEWDPAVVVPVECAAGAWLKEQEGLVFSPTPGTVDAAVMGGQGMVGEGELATVSFRALSTGNPKLRIAALAGRDARNRAVAVKSAVRPSAPIVPLTTRLGFARPNPFLETVTLGLSLARTGPVELAIYGVDGRKVRTLVQETREAGEYEEVWDGRDDQGGPAGAGVYYARLVTSQGRFTRRVTNLK